MREARRSKTAVHEVAAELGVEIDPPKVPARRPRAPRKPNLNGPVDKTVLWKTVTPETRQQALLIAGGDLRRCKPVAYNEVVVLNNPRKEPPR